MGIEKAILKTFKKDKRNGPKDAWTEEFNGLFKLQLRAFAHVFRKPFKSKGYASLFLHFHTRVWIPNDYLTGIQAQMAVAVGRFNRVQYLET